MIERQTSTETVIAGAAWAATTLLLFVGWGLLALGEWEAAILVAETACIVSAVAAVKTIRCYMVRTCALLRNMAAEDGNRIPVQRIH